MYGTLLLNCLSTPSDLESGHAYGIAYCPWTGFGPFVDADIVRLQGSTLNGPVDAVCVSLCVFCIGGDVPALRWLTAPSSCRGSFADGSDKVIGRVILSRFDPVIEADAETRVILRFGWVEQLVSAACACLCRITMATRTEAVIAWSQVTQKCQK